METGDPPLGSERIGKFARPRDEVLDAMVHGGWSNESSGSPLSPTGHFARVSNSEAELPELLDAFEAEIADTGIEPQELIGHFLVVTLDHGECYVREYSEEELLKYDFRRLNEIYRSWLEGV